MTPPAQIVKGVLNPVERLSETLFGLIMTLSFTGTLSVISGGREEVRIMILSVLGCNIAWGIIDGVLYLLGVIGDRGRALAVNRFIREAGEIESARRAVAEALPPEIAFALQPEDLDQIQRRIKEHPEQPQGSRIGADDLRGAFGVFLLVMLSCVPLIIPFLLIRDPLLALRASNAVALAMLFLCGYALARYAGLRKIWTGLAMVALGVAMVGVTIALGG